LPEESGSENEPEDPQQEDDPLSNWIGQYSQTDIRKYQSEDVAIKKMVDLKSIGGSKPKWAEISAEGHDFKTLRAQWSRLIVSDGVLYRTWEDTVPSQPHDHPHLQLVLPTVLRSAIMKELHNRRIMGHLGVARTVARVKRRFYWPSYKADIEGGVDSVGFANKRSQVEDQARQNSNNSQLEFH
jgi:hypothetical protein